MKKAAKGLEALKNTNPQETLRKGEPQDEKPQRDKVVFSLHLPSETHEQLREISFHERTSMTKIIQEGIALALKKRGIE